MTKLCKRYAARIWPTDPEQQPQFQNAVGRKDT